MTGLSNLFRDLGLESRAATVTVAVLSMGLLVPAAEEAFYRGVLHDALSRRLGDLLAVVLTSAGWSLVHLGEYGLDPLDGKVIATRPAVRLRHGARARLHARADRLGRRVRRR